MLPMLLKAMELIAVDITKSAERHKSAQIRSGHSTLYLNPAQPHWVEVTSALINDTRASALCVKSDVAWTLKPIGRHYRDQMGCL